VTYTYNKCDNALVAGGTATPIAHANGKLYTYAVSVGSTATEITSASLPDAERVDIAIFNLSADTAYIGPDESVTTATGFPIIQNGSISIASTDCPIYAIGADQASIDLRVLEII
jgi:hypothetical protein